MQRQAELDAALSSLHCARQVCQLRADIAQVTHAGGQLCSDVLGLP